MAATKNDSKIPQKAKIFYQKMQQKWLETEAQAKSKQINGLQMTS